MRRYRKDALLCSGERFALASGTHKRCSAGTYDSATVIIRASHAAHTRSLYPFQASGAFCRIWIENGLVRHAQNSAMPGI